MLKSLKVSKSNYAVVCLILGLAAQNVRAESSFRICLGAPGTSEYKAATLLAAEMKANGMFDRVLVAPTLGGVSSLEYIASNDCDVAVVRTDATLHYNTLYSSRNATTQNVVALSDGTRQVGDQDENLAPTELYRQYFQLVCHRDSKVESMSDILDAYSSQLKVREKKEIELSKLQIDESTLARKARSDSSKNNDLIEIREKISGVQSDIDKINQSLVEILFVKEGDPINMNQVDPNDQAILTWSQLVRLNPDFQKIAVRSVSPVSGLTAQETALATLRTNPNACFLNIDRLDTIMDQVNSDQTLRNLLRLVPVEDGGWFTDGRFNDKKAGGVPVYSYVKLKDSVLVNLRSKRPEAAWYNPFGKGTSKVKTLAVRTQLVARKNWLQDIGFQGFSNNPNPAMTLKVQTVMKQIKAKMKDPIVE